MRSAGKSVTKSRPSFAVSSSASRVSHRERTAGASRFPTTPGRTRRSSKVFRHKDALLPVATAACYNSRFLKSRGAPENGRCHHRQPHRRRTVRPAMSEFAAAAIVFACVFGGAVIGMFLRGILPAHHLDDQTKDVVRLATGLIATMAALVLGLLVASAKGAYDAEKDDLDR